MGNIIELPRWRCHKVVHAAKILAIDFGTRLDLMPHGVVEVTHEWVEQHKAVAGGYYVVCNDGDSSFSPKEAFEDGYTAMSDPT